MPQYQKPTNDEERLKNLRTSAILGTRENHAHLGAATVTTINTFIPQFESRLQITQSAGADLRQRLRDALLAANQLESQARTVWSAVFWQVRRQGYSPALYAFYGLPSSGLLNPPRARKDWLEVAKRLLQGDIAAVTAGYPGVLNRSLLADAIQTAQQNEEAVKTASLSLQTARKESATLRSEADRLCQEVYKELSFTLRSEMPATRRQIMRSYGLRFRNNAGVDTSEELPSPTTTVLNGEPYVKL